MKTTLDYVRWSREESLRREFTAAQQLVFQLLVGRSNQHGKGYARMSKFAAQTPFTDRYVSTILNQLQAMDLVALTRVRSKPFRWQLITEPSTEQLSFDQPPVDVLDDLQTWAQQPAQAPSVRNPSSERSEVQSSEPVVGPLKDPSSGGREGRAPAAHAVVVDGPDPLRPRPVGVADALTTVLATLREAPGLSINEGAINSVLAGFPERDGFDHQRAAHLAAAQAHNGGLRTPVAHLLLEAQLRRQKTQTIAQTAASTAAATAAAQAPIGSWLGRTGSPEAARQARQARRAAVIVRELGPDGLLQLSDGSGP